MDEDPNFRAAKDAQNKCETHYFAYYDTMVSDMQADMPDMLDTLSVTKGELVAKMTKNKCLGTMKYLAHQHRKRAAELIEDDYLRKTTQKFANQGLNFHPYL